MIIITKRRKGNAPFPPPTIQEARLHAHAFALLGRLLLLDCGILLLLLVLRHLLRLLQADLLREVLVDGPQTLPEGIEMDVPLALLSVVEDLDIADHSTFGKLRLLVIRKSMAEHLSTPLKLVLEA